MHLLKFVLFAHKALKCSFFSKNCANFEGLGKVSDMYTGSLLLTDLL